MDIYHKPAGRQSHADKGSVIGTLSGFKAHDDWFADADCRPAAGAPHRRTINITAAAGFAADKSSFLFGPAVAMQNAAWLGSPRSARSAESTGITATQGCNEDTTRAPVDAPFGNVPRKKRSSAPVGPPPVDAAHSQPGSPYCTNPATRAHELPPPHRQSMPDGPHKKRSRVIPPEYSDSSFVPSTRGQRRNRVQPSSIGRTPSMEPPFADLSRSATRPFQNLPQGPLQGPSYLVRGGMPGISAPAHQHQHMQHLELNKVPSAVSADEMAADCVEKLLLSISGMCGTGDSMGVIAALETVIYEYRCKQSSMLRALPLPHPVPQSSRLHAGRHRLHDDSPTSPYDHPLRPPMPGPMALQGSPVGRAHQDMRNVAAGNANWQAANHTSDALQSLAGVAYMLDQPPVAPAPRNLPRHWSRQESDEYDPVEENDRSISEADDLDDDEEEGTRGLSAKRAPHRRTAKGKAKRISPNDRHGSGHSSVDDDSGAVGPRSDWQSQPGVCKPDGKKRGSSRKRLRQIEVLLAMNLLKELDVLHYRSKSGKIMASGTVKGNGICCHRCDQIVGCTEFERCAGSGLRRPCDNIFTEDGTSLQELLQRADVLMLSGAKALGQQMSGSLGPSGVPLALTGSPSSGAASGDGRSIAATAEGNDDGGLDGLAAAALNE